MKGFNIFKESANELKSVRTITIVAMLIALYVVLKLCTINFGGVIKVSFTYIPLAVLCMFFGPTVGLLAAPICDLVGYLARPDGESYLPLFGIVIIVQALIYGIFLYKTDEKKQIKMIIISKILATFICNIFLNTLILYFFYGASQVSPAVIGTRVLKNLCLLPVEIIILIGFLPILQKIFNKNRKII